MVNAGSQRRLTIIRESIYGTPPATPTMKQLRWSTHTLELTKGMLNSTEIRGDRQLRYLRHGMKRVTGDIAGAMFYGDQDILWEAALCGAWTSEAAGTPNTLKAGVTKYSHSIEDGALDIGQYFLYNGMVCEGFAIKTTAAALCTVQFSFLGRDNVPSGTSVCASPTAPSDNEPFNSLTGTITEGGSAIANVSAIDITLNNGVDPTEAMGSDKPFDYILGDSTITGQLVAYFSDLTLIDKFFNETSSSLSLVLAGLPTNKTLTINIPHLKYTKGQTGVSGPKGMPITMPFSALYDSTAASNIVLTRANPA